MQVDDNTLDWQEGRDLAAGFVMVGSDFLSLPPCGEVTWSNSLKEQSRLGEAPG